MIAEPGRRPSPIVAELLDACRERKIVLSAAGDRLRFRSPPGTMTPDLKGALARHKAELLDLLAGPACGASNAPAECPVPEAGEGFDPTTLDRRAWLAGLIASGEAGRLDPFDFGPGRRIEDPALFARALLSDLERLDGPRCRTGVAQRDLEHFHRLVTRSTPEADRP